MLGLEFHHLAEVRSVIMKAQILLLLPVAATAVAVPAIATSIPPEPLLYLFLILSLPLLMPKLLQLPQLRLIFTIAPTTLAISAEGLDANSNQRFRYQVTLKVKLHSDVVVEESSTVVARRRGIASRQGTMYLHTRIESLFLPYSRPLKELEPALQPEISAGFDLGSIRIDAI